MGDLFFLVRGAGQRLIHHQLEASRIQSFNTCFGPLSAGDARGEVGHVGEERSIVARSGCKIRPCASTSTACTPLPCTAPIAAAWQKDLFEGGQPRWKPAPDTLSMHHKLPATLIEVSRSAGMQSTQPYALVVDDDFLVRMHACVIIEDAGFRCQEADTGDRAIEILEKDWQEVTLLFTDVEMPGKTDGFKLARHVADSWPEIEIVVASGHLTPRDGDLPEKATFIAKPFSSQLVQDHLRQTLPDGKKPEPLKKA